MKTFLSKFALFCAFVIVMDCAFGFFFSSLKQNARGGTTQENYFIAEECTADIIILGSSRATHHYIPSVFSEEFGMSCYNCGKDGNGSILACARFQMLTARYTPKLVIYEITPSFDFLVDSDYSQYFTHIKPYYNKPGVKKIVDLFSKSENKILMHSQMYQNNSRLITNMLDNIFSKPQQLNGYASLYGVMEAASSRTPDQGHFEVDEKKLSILRELIEDCNEKQIPLVFMVSPVFDGINSSANNIAAELAQEYDIPFINHSSFEGISGNCNFFQDITHMNNEGALIYSKYVSNEIHCLLNEK